MNVVVVRGRLRRFIDVVKSVVRGGKAVDDDGWIPREKEWGSLHRAKARTTRRFDGPA